VPEGGVVVGVVVVGGVVVGVVVVAKGGVVVEGGIVVGGAVVSVGDVVWLGCEVQCRAGTHLRSRDIRALCVTESQLPAHAT